MTAPPFSQRPCTGIVLPVLEDANAIQVGIQEIAHAIIENRIEVKRAGLLLYAMQLASANIPRLTIASENGTITVVDDVNSVDEDVITDKKVVDPS